MLLSHAHIRYKRTANGLRSAIRPFPGEHRVDDLVGPLTPDHLVLDEMRLLAQAQLLHQPGGRAVAPVGPAHDPVQPEALEAEPEHLDRGLAGVAVAVVVGVEDEAELALPVLLAAP